MDVCEDQTKFEISSLYGYVNVGVSRRLCHICDKYSKTCLKRPLKIDKTKALMENGCNKGRKYCRMLPLEHSAILLTRIKR